MEKIKSIQEFEEGDREGYSSFYVGYEIITTKQKIQLLIDGDQQCCEVSGYLMSEDNFDDFIGARLMSITMMDDALKTTEAKLKEEHRWGISIEACIFVNINTNKGTLQFTAYNEHNGYYSHNVIVKSNQLDYNGRL